VVVLHHLAKILGTGRSLVAGECDAIRSPVVLDHLRVIDGDVNGVLLEVAHRVAPRLHHSGHRSIGFFHRPSRIVDALAPHLTPLVAQPNTLG
jgi:hypothetical protein